MKIQHGLWMIGSLIVAVAGAGAASAASLEQFDYADGALTGANGGSGWNSAWRDTFSSGGGNFVVTSPGLDHPSLSGEAGGTGFSPGNGSRYHRDLDQTYSSGTVYLSFLMQLSDPTSIDNPFSTLELRLDGDTDSERVFFLGAGRDGDGSSGTDDGFAVVSQDGPGGAFLTPAGNTFVTSSFNTGVNLFVVRFDLDADTAAAFANPDDSTNLAGSGDINFSLYTGFSFDRVGLANFVGSNGTSIDEIRVDTTAPTLVPEPGSLALLSLASMAMLCRRRD